MSCSRAPEHELSLGVGYDGDTWRGSADVSYTDEAFFSDVLTPEFWGETDSHVLVNAKLSRRFPKTGLEAFASVTNLFDEDAKQHVFGDVTGRRATVGLSYRWK